MNVKLPHDYIIQKLYQYSYSPRFNKYSNSYNAGCPICKEGKSFGKRKRLYYFPDKNYFFCHNCAKGWNPINWIIDVTGCSFNDIIKDINDGDFDTIIPNNIDSKPKKEQSILPHDSINLFNTSQLHYYKDNKIIYDCIKFINKRRINNACNKPPALYMSLSDKIHKNRLCIPFYDTNNKIVFYQTRAIYKQDEENFPKYLSKLNSNKTIFGINQIDPNSDYIFIFEGPIDSMFVKNGIAVGGINMSSLQKDQLNQFKLYKKIWIPDCQYKDETALDNTKFLLENGESVFIWPKKYKMFKDINEVCIDYKLDEISSSFFVKNIINNINDFIKLGLRLN